MDHKGKTIWITGASSGIGKAMALELAPLAGHLVLSGRDARALEETAEGCRARGGQCTLIPFDLGDEQSVRDAASTFLSSFDHLDALYHVGGISQRSLVAETPLDVDRRIMEVNFFGTVLLTKLLLPSMLKQGGGQIAATSSVVGKFGFPYRSAYAASKHALHGFFESLLAENGKDGIRVSLIIPGRIQTNISLNALDSEGKKHGLMDQGQAGGTPVDKAARVICRKLAKERKEIHVGGKELLMVHIRRFLPALYYRLAGKVKPL